MGKCSIKMVKLHIKVLGKTIIFVEAEKFIMIDLNILLASLILETFHK
jgi:hypothetical protein